MSEQGSKEELQSHRRRRLEAARWFVILQGSDMSPDVLRSWKRWEADPENRKAFDVTERLWANAENAARPVVPSLSKTSADDDYDGSESVEEWRARKSLATASTTRSRAHHNRYWYMAMAATVLLSIGSLTLLALDRWRPVSRGTHVSVFATGVGDHRDIQLSDGSIIQLGARTSVTTSMDDRSRTVVLDRGEALFKVAHDASRPFSVMAGGGMITAVGTAFNVRRRDDNQVVVTVTEGVVQISPTRPEKEGGLNIPNLFSLSSSTQKRLERGQEITYDFGGSFSEPRIADEAIAITWQDGRLTYRGENLRNVLLDVNRYSEKQIVLGDRAAGELLYSGTVFERDVGEWIANLEAIYPQLEVTATDADNILVGTRAISAKK